MHMADALISPAVGSALWIGSGAAVAYALRSVERESDDRRIPLMGVTGAFLFASQMITIAIPGTGSSGHLAGGVLLSALLGPHAALLVMATVLAIQALLFADGGILAYGCNLFNLGVIPAYLVYPFCFRPLLKLGSGLAYPRRLVLAAIPACIVALQLGALAVVVQTAASGVVQLPLLPFLLLMQPIHLAIGLLEAALTAAIMVTLYRMQPELFIQPIRDGDACGTRRFLMLAGSMLGVAVLIAGLLSWFASQRPDGLEWSLAAWMQSGQATLASSAHAVAAKLQSLTAFFPDYSLAHDPQSVASVSAAQRRTELSLTGIFGLLLTLVGALSVGYLARCLHNRN